MIELVAPVERGVKVVAAGQLHQESGVVEAGFFAAGSDVEQIKRPRMGSQGRANLHEQVAEEHLGARIEEKQDGRLGRQFELEEILAKQFDVGAAHEVARVGVEIALRDCMKVW